MPSETMRDSLKRFLSITMLTILCACGISHHAPRVLSNSHVQPVRIRHIPHEQGSQELMLQSISLIGTPYHYGGSSVATGFDCSGMVQYVYKTALNVNLPRTARDLAAASRSVSRSALQTGDLVFFDTGAGKYSHVGIYIGNGEFIHAPSSNSSIHTSRLDNPYFAKHFSGGRTFF